MTNRTHTHTLTVIAFFFLGLFKVTVLTPLLSDTMMSSPDEVIGFEVDGPCCSLTTPTNESTKSQYPFIAFSCNNTSSNKITNYIMLHSTLFMSPRLFQLSHFARPTKSIIPGLRVLH